MYCKYCGRQIADDSKFCEFCGNLIQRSGEAAPERVPDIPASIGEPIFKEVVFEEPAPVAQEAPTQKVTPPEPEPVEEEEALLQEEPEKKGKKGLLWGLIGGGVALLTGIIILLVVLLGGKTVQIDLTQYVDFKVTGYDGFGVATCQMDWDTLEAAVLGEYPSGSDSKTREKQLKYKEKAAILRSGITLELDKLMGVKVGDVLVARLSVNASTAEELGVVFTGERTVEYTVKPVDLNGSSEIDLAKEFIDVRFEGVSGKGTATLIPKERTDAFIVVTADGKEFTMTVEFSDNYGVDVKLLNAADKSTETVHIDCALSKETELQADEKITLHFGVDTEKALMEYGLLIAETEAEYTVTGLESYVNEFAQIDEKTLSGWKTTYVATLQKRVMDNWGDYFHGGNDIRPLIQTMEDITHEQSVLILGEEQTDLYLVYSATVADDAILADNFHLPRTYHFAVRVGDLRIDGEGQFLTDVVLLPSENTDDFIGGYLDYDELMQVITDGTDYVLETEN